MVIGRSSRRASGLTYQADRRAAPMMEKAKSNRPVRLSAGSGAGFIGQDEIVSYGFEHDLGKRFRNSVPHLLAGSRIKRMGKCALPGFVIWPLRVAIPNSIAPPMQSGAE